MSELKLFNFNRQGVVRTCEQVGLRVGKAELSLEVLWKEDDEATDDGELHARAETRHNVHGIVQQPHHALWYV